MSIKKLHISKSLIESYQNLNMSEVNKADSFNLCLSYLYWCFLIRIWLETVSQEKALKNLREMKKKEEGSLLPLWRRTVYKVKQIVQKGSGRPDLRFGPASCFGLKLCRRRKFWKMKKWKKEAYFRWGGAHWTRLKKFVQEGSGQMDLRFSKYRSRRIPVQPVASSSLDQKNGSLKWMCHKRKLWKICMI